MSIPDQYDIHVNTELKRKIKKVYIDQLSEPYDMTVFLSIVTEILSLCYNTHLLRVYLNDITSHTEFIDARLTRPFKNDELRRLIINASNNRIKYILST